MVTYCLDEDRFPFPDESYGFRCSACLCQFDGFRQRAFIDHVAGCPGLNLGPDLEVLQQLGASTSLVRIPRREGAYQAVLEMAERSRREQGIGGALVTWPPKGDLTLYGLWEAHASRLLGYCAFRSYPGPSGSRRVLQDLWVQPRARGTGIATELVRGALETEGLAPPVAVNAPLTRGSARLMEGLGHDVVDYCFPGTSHWHMGVSLSQVGHRGSSRRRRQRGPVPPDETGILVHPHFTRSARETARSRLWMASVFLGMAIFSPLLLAPVDGLLGAIGGAAVGVIGGVAGAVAHRRAVWPLPRVYLWLRRWGSTRAERRHRVQWWSEAWRGAPLCADDVPLVDRIRSELEAEFNLLSPTFDELCSRVTPIEVLQAAISLAEENRCREETLRLLRDRLAARLS